MSGIIDRELKMTRKPPKTHVWLHAHINYKGNGCLRWPFSVCNGYGNLKYGGRITYAHRVMCELVHGPVPSPNHEAAHICGNGHKGCVHPEHIAWKTRSANQKDRAAQGTKNTWAWRGKITQRIADEIRALKGKVPQRILAARYGISRSNVSFIHCGKAWTGNPHKYSQFQCANVISD